MKTHRLRAIAFCGLGILFALPALVLIAGNLAPVRQWVEAETPSLTGGMVHITGLHGRFPDALRLDHLTLSDAHGAYAAADDIVLDWSPTALLFGTAQVDTASIARLAVLRRPIAAKSTPSQQSATASLPVSIDLRTLRIGRADIAASVAGTAFSASLQASGKIGTSHDAAASLTVIRLDSAGTYHLDGALRANAISAHLSLLEPQGGLIAALGQLPGLGPIALTASIDGPRTAEQARLDARIGQLRAALTGFADLPGKTINVDVAATAPAMHPGRAISWQAIGLHAHVAGPFGAPDATGHLVVTGLQAAGASLPSLQADIAGNEGDATLHGVLTGLRIPGKNPDLFADAPFDLRAHMILPAYGHPVAFRLTQPRLTIDGTANATGPLFARVHVHVPDLAPIAAAAAGASAKGHADVTASLATIAPATPYIHAIGTIFLAGAAVPAGLHGDTNLDIEATRHGSDITLRQATLINQHLHLDAGGTYSPAAVALHCNASVPDLAAFLPQSEGYLAATGQVSGSPQDLSVQARITGNAGARRYASGPIDVTLHAASLPAAPNADLSGNIFLAGADLTLAATARTDATGTIHATIDHADWKSEKLRADITTPKGGTPSGKLTFAAGNLADFAALTGQPLRGTLGATLTTTETDATVKLDGRNLAAGANSIAALALTGRAAGLQSDPDITATLALNGIQAGQISGDAKITAAGRAAALQLHADANVGNLQGAPATLTAAALLDAKQKHATLQTLSANWKNLALRLQAQSRFELGPKIAVDRMRLALNQASLDIAGQFGPTLDFTARLKNVTPDLATSFIPGLDAAGILAADAHLTGPQAAPNGTLHLHATGLRQKSGPAASLPAATLAATVTLAGGTANLDAHVNAGAKFFAAATGNIPLRPDRVLAVHSIGHADLSLLNPVLQASGREAKGTAAFDLTAAGTQQSPRVTGTVTLADADIRDFVQGLHLERINGRIDATGDTLAVTRLSAHAGPGTIDVAGTVGLAQPQLPVNLHITASNARPLASDLMTATFDADLEIRGDAAANMDATGTVKLRRMDINIPDNLPPSVAVLQVRRPGQKSPAQANGPAAPPSSVRLTIDVDAPGSIFVRGKGLNAEMAGKLQLRGTSATPQIDGGFNLRRGDFSLAGTSLNFTKGDVSFNGEGVTKRIDPTLDFEADSYSGNITATLSITGYADAPKISLSSVPDLPQDEVLAHLLFGQSTSQLSPLQIAEIGAALAEIAGLTGSGEGPLGAVRRGLGLDRLSVGGGNGGAGTSIEAGRYVARGVYVGTRQSTSGAGTQVQVQIDLTRRLKLNSTLGTGGGTAQGATPDNDPGSSIGLSYGFEY